MERAASAGGHRALFPKDSFSLKDFSSKDFIVRDFVDHLAETALPTNRRSGPAQQAPFDPKPLIRTFESTAAPHGYSMTYELLMEYADALSQLGSLSEELQEQESDILSQVRRAELQHDQTLETLGRKLDQSMAQFEVLDLSLNSTNGANGHSRRGSRQSQHDAGGNIAVQIGEKLEELDRKRRRAQDANFLIQCWVEVSESGQLSSLEEIRRQGNPENKVRCAAISKQLMRISQRLDPAAWGQTTAFRSQLNRDSVIVRKHNTREILEKFRESLEQDLLNQFTASYKYQKYDDMMECSKVLYDFNEGASVIAQFINQHPFFIGGDQLTTDEVTSDSETWDQLADPDADPSGVEPSLQSLVDEVKIILQEESFMIKRAFPYHEIVLVRFIQRVFQQSIQQRLEMVLEKAKSISSLTFLRSLHASRSYISALIEDLKAHGLTEHPEPASAQISQTLDQQMEELFVPYLVGTTYIDRERKSLEELYSSLLFKYTIFHSRRKKAPSGFMASLAQQGNQLLASAKDAALERLESADATAVQKAILLRVAGLKDNSNDKNDIEVSDEDGVLSLPYAKRMLTWLAESVRRTLELNSALETPKDVSVLLNLLLTSMGQVYIETALDAALDAATAQESIKSEPDLSYLPSIRPAVTITALMSRFINTVLIRLAETNATVRRNMETQTKTAIESIERKTNNVLRSTLDVAINYATRTLGTQKKLDFRPRDDDLENLVESLQTPTCAAICTFLSRLATVASQAMDGHNLEMFSTELALAVYRLLFEHFKKFQVNATGGLMVTKDIARYVDTMKEWPINKDTEGIVEMLTEVGYLFIIGPEALKERSRNLGSGTSGGHGKKLLKGDFKAFVGRREDVGTPAIQALLVGI